MDSKELQKASDTVLGIIHVECDANAIELRILKHYGFKESELQLITAKSKVGKSRLNAYSRNYKCYKENIQ